MLGVTSCTGPLPAVNARLGHLRKSYKQTRPSPHHPLCKLRLSYTSLLFNHRNSMDELTEHVAEAAIIEPQPRAQEANDTEQHLEELLSVMPKKKRKKKRRAPKRQIASGFEGRCHHSLTKSLANDHHPYCRILCRRSNNTSGSPP